MLTNKLLLQPGIDFAGNFEKDNFASRRTTGNNMFDPESLITGEELAAGLTYTNSRRVYLFESDYQCAVHSNRSLDQVIELNPRVLIG